MGICQPGRADDQEESGAGTDSLPGKPSPSVSLAANDQRESGVFNYLEKKSEKRIFYSYLNRFELNREHLGPKVSRRVLSEIFKHSNAVSRRFDEPVASVSQNVIGAAAWGTIYCLLGPTRMIEMAPDYQAIIDEVELELLTSSSEQDSENSIYQEVFSILIDHGLCHPEVLALIDTCIDVSLGRRKSGKRGQREKGTDLFSSRKIDLSPFPSVPFSVPFPFSRFSRIRRV